VNPRERIPDKPPTTKEAPKDKKVEERAGKEQESGSKKQWTGCACHNILEL
jgi:hypothetical protein